MRRPLLEIALFLWACIIITESIALPFAWLVFAFISLLIVVLILLMKLKSPPLPIFKLIKPSVPIRDIKNFFEKFIKRSSCVNLCRIKLFLIILSLVAGLSIYKLESRGINSFNPIHEPVQVTGVVLKVSEFDTLLMDTQVTLKSGQVLKVGKLVLKPKWGTKQFWSMGDKVRVRGDLLAFENERNPNTFSPKKYYASQGIRGQIKSSHVELVKQGYSKLYTYIGIFQSQFNKRLSLLFNDSDASLLRGLLLGDTQKIDQDTLRLFRASGTAHIMAVSGLHFGILYMLILKILSLVKLSYKRATCLSLAIMFVFVLLSGVSFSAVRAFIMVGLHSLSVYLKRKYDMLNALGFVVIISFLTRPFIIWSVGFQLSFWAVFAIGAYSQYKGKIITGFNFELIELPVVMYLALLPLGLFHFNQYNFYSILFNIPIAVLMPLTFIQSIIGVILGDIPLLGPGIVYITSAFLTCLREVVALVERLPFGMTKGPSPDNWLLVVFYGFMSILMLSFTFRHKVIKAYKTSKGVCLALAFSLGLLLTIPGSSQTLTLDFLDVGQGDSTLIKCPNGQVLLIDAGPQKADLQDILLKQGINKVDAAFISHFDSDHYFGMTEIADSIKVENIYHGKVESKKDRLRDLKALYPKTNFVELQKGESLSFEDVHIQVIHPSGKGADPKTLSSNNLSLVLLFKYAGKSILFTGDIEEDVEHNLVKWNDGLNNPIDIDVLKVAHHGSNSSTRGVFIESFKPEIGLIQVGKNFFGHPTDQTLKTLERHGVQVYRNDTQGCIRMKVKKHDIDLIPWLTIGP